MPDFPLVSIAAINYNNAQYIIDTLDSINGQTYPNIELIIVDDCSTDNSVELIKGWLKGCTRQYKFICHEENKGVCVACNTGLKNSTGKYFSAIGTDDSLIREKIDKQVDLLEATGNEVGALYSDAYLMDVNGAPLEGFFIQNHRQFSTNPSGNIYQTLLQGNYLPAMSLLIKRSVLEDIGVFDEGLVYEDYDMWLRIARKYEIIFSDFVSVKYRIRPGSLSSTITNWNYSDAKIFLKHANTGILPFERLKRITRDAYSTADKDTMLIIKKLGKATKNRYFKAAWLLWKYKVNYPTAEIVLARIDGYFHAQISNLYIDLCIYKDIYGAMKAGNSSLLQSK
jgi:glycosyltransferase involved in cell wall biosynthesis